MQMEHSIPTTCQRVRFSFILLFDEVQQKLKLPAVLGAEPYAASKLRHYWLHVVPK